MITFICCSVRPETAKTLEKNIGESLGLPYEFIAFDNRKAGLGICEVYNDCARRAKYEYLCFLHEDVIFNTPNWGEGIISKLNEQDCGVIGFAGCIIKLNIPSGWGVIDEVNRINLRQLTANKEVKHIGINPKNELFSQVVTLDGLALFVRCEVWRQFPFDQESLRGFHCYDIDLSLSIAQHYKNYVCHTIDITHLSEGSFNKEWADQSNILHQKWSNKLPIFTPHWSENHSPKDIIRLEYKVIRRAIKSRRTTTTPRRAVISYFKRYWYKSPYPWRLLFSLCVGAI